MKSSSNRVRSTPHEFGRLLFSSFTGNLVLPIYSVFVPLLAYRLGASVFEVGLVGGAANAMYAFMPFVVGRISDRTTARKFFITLAFLVLSVVSISYVFIPNPVALIVARLFEGIGWATLWPSVEVAVSSGSLTDAKRSLSIFNFTWSGSAAFGPLIGSALIFFASLRETFVITSIIMIGTLAVNAYALIFVHGLKEPAVRGPLETVPSSVPIPSPPRPYGARLYVLCMTVASVSSGVLYTFFTPFAESIGISIIFIGTVIFGFGFARFLTNVFIVRERVRQVILSHSLRLRILVISLVVMTVSPLLMLIHNPSGLVYLLPYALCGSGYSIVYSVSQAAMIAESPQEKMGQNAGLFESSIGIGQSIGPVAAGAIAGTSLVLPFALPSLGLVAFFVLLPLALLFRRRRTQRW